MEPELLGIVTKLIDGLAGRNRIDVVDDLAYPFPVAVICELLGVPHEDEPRFHAWVEKGIESLDPKLDPTEQQRTKAQVVAKLRVVADFLACCLVDKWIPAATVPEQAIVRRTMSGSPRDCRRGYFAFLAASSWPGSSGAVAFRTSSANFR
jgi:hypothetical protein